MTPGSLLPPLRFNQGWTEESQEGAVESSEGGAHSAVAAGGCGNAPAVTTTGTGTAAAAATAETICHSCKEMGHYAAHCAKNKFDEANAKGNGTGQTKGQSFSADSTSDGKGRGKSAKRTMNHKKKAGVMFCFHWRAPQKLPFLRDWTLPTRKG